VALAAAIFSMQQEVIPFDLNPRSFALAVLLLIVMVYAIRSAIRHTLSHLLLLRRTIISRIKAGKLGESSNKPIEELAFPGAPC
jgi:hypothetical protein